MSPFPALIYSFFFGLLHGILPDEHTWPITFSYAIGSASGREGMKAGLYFSGAFTFQRMLLSEVSYLALAPFLLTPTINGTVYLLVGIAMSIAGAIVLKRNHAPHVHLFHVHDEEVHKLPSLAAPPPRWTILHGFLAGFGFGGFSLFINTVAAPAMPGAWLGFLPGLLFGLGTMIMLVLLGLLFGSSLRWAHAFTEEEIRRVGAYTGGRTLYFGGFLFGAFGVATLLGLDRHLPLEAGYVIVGLFMLAVVIPAFWYSLRQVRGTKGPGGKGGGSGLPCQKDPNSKGTEPC